MEQESSYWEFQEWGKANSTNRLPGGDKETELRERDREMMVMEKEEPQRLVCVGGRHKHTGTNVSSWNTACSDGALEVQYSVNQPSNVIPLPQK